MKYSPENVLSVLAVLRLKGIEEPCFWTQTGEKNIENHLLLARIPYSRLKKNSQIAYWNDLLRLAGLE